MILNVSGRTDIVAFYSDWFMKRLDIGYVDVRNPFNPKLISRIYFDDVDLILFCTKNPWPIIDKLKNIKKPILFHVTITPFKKDIEPGVIDKSLVIEGVKKISEILGRENVVVRYDPIFISDKYNLEYHKRAFNKLCNLLNGYVNKIIVSFIDDYKNVRKNEKNLNFREFTESDYKDIGLSFSKSANSNNMSVQTCFEKELAYKLTGKHYKTWTARKGGKCACVNMVDIGAYNTCKHFCKYCYANYDEKKVIENMGAHDESSSLLIGHIEDGDVIKIRRY